MQEVNKLKVLYQGRLVGTLVKYDKYRTVFAYDKEWLADGFAISPFSLPLSGKPFVANLEPFDGLFGVFADSLPDGWGRLLVDRMLLKHKLSPQSIDNLQRLAIVGNAGMGVLTYEPDYHFTEIAESYDLDKLSAECQQILASQNADDLDTLFKLGGSSGGARPKILTKIDNEEWIIKFPSHMDALDIGLQEYDYAVCAKACGLEMAETKLFPSKTCAGYFGTKRFDRVVTKNGMQRVHMLSASGLLETSHRIPNLDYLLLGKLTMSLTKSFNEIEKLYKLMCFNVFAHNRDDHSKNFSFLYSEAERSWHLSPAYDLTYSFSLGGEHATTVNGNGRNPGMQDLLEVGRQFGMTSSYAKSISREIQECVQVYLGAKYLNNKD